jgi:hypothetical protein
VSDTTFVIKSLLLRQVLLTNKDELQRCSSF